MAFPVSLFCFFVVVVVFFVLFEVAFEAFSAQL